MARRATLIDSLRREGPIVVVDAGGFAEVDPPMAADKSGYIVSEFGRMGYDAVVVSTGDAAVLSSVDDSVLLRASTGDSAVRTIRRGGRTIGLFTTDGLVDATPDDTVDEPVDESVDVADAARRAVDRALAAGSDLVVWLTALPVDVVDAAVSGLPELDVVVLSHPSARRRRAAAGEHPRRIATHPKGRAVTVFDLTAPDVGPTLVLLGRDIPREPSVQARVDSVLAAEGARRHR